MLMLRSKNLLHGIHRRAELPGPVRSAVLGAAATGVGLAAGKTGHRHAAAAAVVAGAAASLGLGLTAIGDGMLGGGLALIGYRVGAKMDRGAAVTSLPAVPQAARPAQRRRV